MTEPVVQPAPESEAEEHFRTDHLAGDLKGRSIRGGAATMAAQGLSFVLQTVGTVVLARLLSPSDFGLVAMVTAITGFVLMFKDLGLSMATIQRKDITHEQVSTLFWVNVALSAVAMLVTAALAPVVAWFYGESRLVWITMVVGASFLFGGLTVQHQALLRRQMRFTVVAVVQVLSTGVGVAAGVVSAVLGAGYWSLIVMQVATALAGMVGVWIASGWRPGPPVRKSGVRSMLAFGGYLTGFSVINYFARNLDHILVGRVCGAPALGLYSKAYALLILPLTQIAAPVAAVAIPGLSKLQDDPERFRRYYLNSLSLIMLVTAPLSVLSLVMADEIVIGVLGPQWVEAASLFRLLAISALIQPIYSSMMYLYVPMGRTKELLVYGGIGVVLIVASFFVGLPWGAKGVALSYSIAMLLWFWPCMYFAARGTLITFGDIVRSVLDVVVGALAGGVAALVLKYYIADANLWARLILGVVVMTAIYFVTVFLFFGRRSFYFSVFRSLVLGGKPRVGA